MTTHSNDLPGKVVALLERRMRAAGLSRAELAEKLGQTPAAVDGWIAAPENMTLQCCAEVAEALDQPCWAFIKEAEDPETAGSEAAGTGVPRPYARRDAGGAARRLAEEMRGPLTRARDEVVPTSSLTYGNQLLAEIAVRRELLSEEELNAFLRDTLERFRTQFPLP